MVEIGYRKLEVIILQTLSFVGMIVIAIMILFMPRIQDAHSWSWIAGSLYGLICILGIIAVFYPGSCSRIFYSKKWDVALNKLHEDRSMRLLIVRVTHGHHPRCKRFSDHKFTIGKRVFCAGCTGLLTGTMISVSVVSAHFLNKATIDHAAIPLVAGGFIGVANGLLIPVLVSRRGPMIRLVTNAFFIIGTALLLVGTDALLNDVQINLYLIALDIFWVMTRISVSRFDHEKICYSCAQECVSSQSWH